MDDTWAIRDRPVLEAAVTLLEDKHLVQTAHLTAATGLDMKDVGRALNALEGQYLELKKGWGGPEGWMVVKATSEARRAVGQWPTPESLVDRLAEAFGEAAENEPNEEKKTRLRQVAGFLASAGRDVATEVVSKIILHSTGMG